MNPILLSSVAGPPSSLNITWQPPFGMEFEVETSSNLSAFQAVPGRYKADGPELRHTQFFPPIVACWIPAGEAAVMGMVG